jgi:hypothetical protein
MATVRFSEKLREDIIQAATNKFQNAVNTANTNGPDPVLWGDKLWALFYGQYESVLVAVPAQFVIRVTKFTLDEIHHSANSPVVKVNMEFMFSKEMPWPTQGIPGSGLVKSNSWREVYSITAEKADDPAVQELTALIVARQTAIQEATKRRDEFKSSVKQVINAHATLAPALKMWPPLWDLLSEDVKNKHREVTERGAKATAETVGVDLNRLTALASLSKMGGA